MVEVDAWIGLGSNLDDPRRQVTTALAELDRLAECRLRAASSLYASPPMGPPDQPDYINAVARLGTRLSAHALLEGLQALERRHGRVRGVHWGPRSLDLDLLVFGDAVIEDAQLRVPHPGIAARSFVLYPLAELDRTLCIPGVGRVGDLLDACPPAGLEKLEAD